MTVFFGITLGIGLLMLVLAYSQRDAPSDSIPEFLYIRSRGPMFACIAIGALGLICVTVFG